MSARGGTGGAAMLLARVAAMLLAAGALGTACGRAAAVAPGASPAAGRSAPDPALASTATPLPAPGSRVVLTGALAAVPDEVSAARPCGRLGSGYGVDLRFQVGGRDYALAFTVFDYHGPGTYTAPPNRVSVRTLGPGSASFYGGTSGDAVVANDGGSGRLEEDLEGQGGQLHASASWTC